jgi:SAM-dependent methyltransferase
MPLPIPWRLKLHLKLGLSRLGWSYALWKKLRLFEHGKMDNPGYAMKVFQRHFDAAAPPRPFTALELGPGDSLASALIAAAYGAARIILVDAGDFAKKDPRVYHQIAHFLEREGLNPPKGWQTLEEMLEACHAEYLTGGLSSLQALASGSVDFIWSQAVLEHVRRRDFAPTIAELRRCLSPRGVMTHQIDLADHFGGALNNLRFPESKWESEAWASSGFYTNRLRKSEIIQIFEKEGLSATMEASTRWKSLPTPAGSMDSAFHGFSSDDLCIRDFFVKCRLCND